MNSAELLAVLDEMLYQAYAAGREDEAAARDPFAHAAREQRSRLRLIHGEHEGAPAGRQARRGR